MFTNHNDTAHSYLNSLENKDSFDPSDLDNFPYEEYHENLRKYSDAEDWFSGDALDAFEDSLLGSDPVNKYPVKINPFQAACFKHTYALFGEQAHDERPLVIPRLIKEGDGEGKEAEEGERILSKLWWENSGRSLQFINGLHSQIYGGCIFKASWNYYNRGLRQYPLVIEAIHPKFFIGIPKSSNLFTLNEAWFVRVISHREARDFGVTVEDTDLPWLIEHITESTMESTINGQPISILLDDGRRKSIPTENPWGFVPAVYIPHLRTTGYYGENAIDNAIGMVKELNLRMADFGDAISIDSHGLIALRNVNGTPKVQPLAKGRYSVNLGSSLAGMAEKGQPDAFDLGRVYASQSMKDINDVLYDHIRRALYIPAVADGEDEGSQRSALTLYIRMWPLIQHTNTERVHWTDGLNLFTRMMLKMLETDEKSGITEPMTKMIVKQQWASVLPRDREVLVNEVVQRIASNLGSPELMLELLGDSEDPEEELKRIKEWMKFVAENTATTMMGNNDPSQPQKNSQPKKDKEIKSNA